MTGSVKLTNIGFQGEIYLKDLENFFNSIYSSRWNPYINTGIQFNFIQKHIKFNFGRLDFRQFCIT